MRVWTLISILFLIVLSLWVYPCEGDSTEVCPASGDGSESVGCGGSDSSIIDESDKTAHGNEEGSEQSGEVVNEEVQHIIPKGANAEGKPLDVSFDDCQDRHPEKCQAWSGAGECDNNPGISISSLILPEYTNDNAFIRYVVSCLHLTTFE